jgi:hypothetical protein
VIALPQGIAMVPLSERLRFRFGPAERPWLYEPAPDFAWLPAALLPHLLDLSERGPVAYVEAEYHGGSGEQRSAVWRGRAMTSGPDRSSWAINSALRALGVEREGDHDAFDTLGLGRHRDTEDWLSEP